ncbi:polysaccharide pyruvyl transferase family protein [Raoultella sp. BAC10a-01-01]|uniref:Polysaccharide pyruvyl transferase family protein n=1 Tax=Raoultella scottii TaxID=3040937 RepID=A0ABU8Z5X9_9ENTR
MIIEIKGVQFVNKGAELMMHAIIQQMRTRWPDAEFVLLPHNHSPYYERISVASLQKFNFRKNTLDLNFLSYFVPAKIRSYLKNSYGIVTEPDVDVILDASGFAYSDKWGSLLINQMSQEVIRFNKNNKKYIFLSQAFGPFTKNNDKVLLRKSLPKASLICAREKTSYDFIREFSEQNVEMYPDFTNLVKGDIPDYYHNGDKKIVIIPNHNMINSKNDNLLWSKNYVSVLCMAVNVIKQIGFKPVLLNHEGKLDGEICQKIREQVNDIDLEIITESDPLKVKGIIGASVALISSRFHGCVSALCQGIPCIGTSWSHKYERLFEDYGREKYLMTPEISEEDLKLLLCNCMNKDSNDYQIYTNKITELKNETIKMWDKISMILSK